MNKNLFLPALMAGMILLPSADKLINTGAFFFLFPVSMLLVSLAEGKKDKILSGFQLKDLIVVIVVFLFSLIGMVLKISGILKVDNYSINDFLVMISVILLCIGLKAQANWERWYFDVLIYAGGLILVLYFVNTAVVHDMIPLWDKGTESICYMNIIALLVMLIAVGQYIYCEDRIMQIVYIVGAVLAVLVMAVNAAWGTALVAFIMMMVYSVMIVPIAAIVRRLLQMFFGIAFLFCNMSLLVNYSKLIQVENLSYSLESSVVGELVLCLFALYVMEEWDKIPEGVELTRVRLLKLQTGFRHILRSGACLIIIMTVLGCIDSKLGMANLVQLFVGDKWKQMSGNIFMVTFLSFCKNINQSLEQALQGNILAVMYQMYGVIGVGVAISIFGLACYKLYLTIRDDKIVDLFLTWITIGILVGMICLPVMVEVLPICVMIILLAIYSSSTIDGEKEVEKEKVIEEDKTEFAEKEHMHEGIVTI